MSSRRQKPLARPGEVIEGRYRLGELVARGGGSDVFRARDKVVGGKVAIKLLRATAGESGVEYRRFQREAALLQGLDHPNVARALHHGLTERGVPFMVLELVTGTSLGDLIKEHGPLGEARTATISRQVLEALDAAHRAGIVHRDVKPANILITGDDVVKLIDFGLAKSVNAGARSAQLTEKGMAVGTPRYMAPEQVRGLDVGKPVDLYPLGLIMAEMLSGEPLLRGTRAIEIIRQHASREPLDLPEVVSRSRLGPVIARAVGKSLGERFRSAEQMMRALDQAMAGDGTFEA